MLTTNRKKTFRRIFSYKFGCRKKTLSDFLASRSSPSKTVNTAPGSRLKHKLKVLLRSKFNVKFVTKTLSFQFIRSGCTCFGHWSELWRPLSENIELENVGFSRPPLQIYVPVTKLLFSDCDVIFWTRQENKPEPGENSERFQSKLRSSSPDSGIVKEEIIDYDDSVQPAPTEYEKVKY